MKKSILFIMIVFVTFLVSCDNRDANFDHIFERSEGPIVADDSNNINDGENDEMTNEPSESTSDNHSYEMPLESELYGELTIWTHRYNDYELRIYAELFSERHPNVTFNFEAHDFPRDTATHLALVTGLIATPPDLLLFNSSTVNFEKLSVDALFVELYELFDGYRGIDMDSFFANVFSALELHGGLYGVPLFIDLMLAYPNIRLFEGADIDISTISSVSIDDEILLYSQIAPAFPDETIHPTSRFSVWRALTRNVLYDINTEEINVNTSEMAERLRNAMEIPICSIHVQLTPDRPRQTVIGSGTDQFLRPITQSNLIFVDHRDGGSFNFSTLFLQEHPDIQFAKPVPFTFGDSDNVGFKSSHTLSIMRESPNIELAWEFMRFVLSYEESLYHNENYHNSIMMPINRNRFNNQVYDVLQSVFRDTLSVTDIEKHITIPIEEFRAQQIESALLHIYAIMENLNFEFRQNSAVLNSLVYPDIWLIYSGQQTIEQGLASIQSRLELYVHE
ncbi:MAG: hypothetical protein FWD05_09015 [Oscillospiraceae bacterium]|nr:hypothetical protein [Oscillospiraceae bacterium]